MTISSISQKIIPILQKNHVSKAAIFGSTARGKAKKNSDIDILIKFSRRSSLLDLCKLQYLLEDALHKKVDLLTYDGINHLIRDSILKDQKIIYDQKPQILS